MPLLGWERVSRDNPDYKACLAVTTAGGAIVGGATGSPLLLPGVMAGYAAGAAWGLAIGYLACPYLAPAVRQKIQAGAALSDLELRSASEAMGQYAGVSNASDAIKLVRLVKGARAPRTVQPCMDPRIAAKQLLKTA
jgi:hypothetical protein